MESMLPAEAASPRSRRIRLAEIEPPLLGMEFIDSHNKVKSERPVLSQALLRRQRSAALRATVGQPNRPQQSSTLTETLSQLLPSTKAVAAGKIYCFGSQVGAAHVRR